MKDQKIPFQTIIGAVIAEIREAKQLSQKQAAENAGLAQSTLARMELGRAFTLENLIKIARTYDCTPSAILQICEGRADVFTQAGGEVLDEIPKDETQWTPGNERALFAAAMAVGGVLGGPISAAIFGVSAAILANKNKK